MICIKCKNEIESDSVFCRFCGHKVKKIASPKKRGNGTGTVVKDGTKWKATVTLGYSIDKEGKMHRQTKSRFCETKKEALAVLPELFKEPAAKKKSANNVTFSLLYEKWLPTHRAAKSTVDCYKAAYRYFADVHNMKMSDITIDDLQECVDDCPKGIRTMQNMKALCGLMYKFGIPRNMVPNNLNLAPYLALERGSASHRISFTPEQINAIRGQIGAIFGAEYVYCMIYTGFRPSEFLALKKENYDDRGFLRGGSKTEAGTNRTVTLSPKIASEFGRMFQNAEDFLCTDENGRPYELKRFTNEVFYPVLDAAGIDNPVVGEGDSQRHLYTPHSCRHTFSTLMKNIDAPSKDKLELMGHTSEQMLSYYQDVSVDDLKKITDLL